MPNQWLSGDLVKACVAMAAPTPNAGLKIPQERDRPKPKEKGK